MLSTRGEEDRDTLAALRASYRRRYEALGCRVQAPVPLVPPPDPSMLITNSVLAGTLPQLRTARTPRLAVVGTQVCIRYGGVSSFHTTQELSYKIESGERSVFFEQAAVVQGSEQRPIDRQMHDLLLFLTADVGIEPDRLRATFHHQDLDLYERWDDVAGGDFRTEFSDTGHRSHFLSGHLGRALHLVFDLVGDCRTNGVDCGTRCPCGRWLDLADLIVFEDETGTVLVTDSGLSLDRLLVAGGRGATETDVAESAEIGGWLIDENPTCGESGTGDVRFLADHLRAAAALLAHGLTPSNKGAGYVLKRMIRRCVLRGKSLDVTGARMAHMMIKSSGLVASLRPGVPGCLDGVAVRRLCDDEFQACDRLVDRACRFLEQHTDPGTGEVTASPKTWNRARDQDGLSEEVFGIARRRLGGGASD